MSQILVYLNSAASQSELPFTLDELKTFFFRYDIHIKTPRSIQELIQDLKRERANQNIDTIFSIGGDGTVHTLAQELIGSNIKLMALPGGTANDFATEVGTKAQLKKIASIFYAQSTRCVDTVDVNGRYLLSNGGIGIAQSVADEVNKMRRKHPEFKKVMKKLGSTSYMFFFLKQMVLKKFEQHNLYVDSPDFPRLERKIISPLILINNQPRLAGLFQVAPETKNNDGHFNVTIFLHQNKWDFLQAVATFFKGKYPREDDQIISFETKEITITSLEQKKLSFFGDGELWQPSNEIVIKAHPQSLTVFAEDLHNIAMTGYSLNQIPEIL